MKKIFVCLMVAASVVSATASAQSAKSPMLHVLQCRQDNSVLRDAGYRVVINVALDPNGQISHQLIASLLSMTIAGEKLVAAFNVEERQFRCGGMSFSRCFGAPKVYYGTSGEGTFELSVKTTATPVDGHMPADLRVEMNNHVVAERMLCDYVR